MLQFKISTDITIREITDQDAEIIFSTIDSQRAYLGEWLPFVEHTNQLSDTQAFINYAKKAKVNNREYVFVIEKENKFAGIINLKIHDRLNQKCEIGYWLSYHFQKQGIMRQSVQTICNFAFEDKEMNRIQIKCAVENERSKRIPQALDFQFEGVERAGERRGDGFADLEVYSKLKGE